MAHKGDARGREREVPESEINDTDAVGDETGFARRSSRTAEAAVRKGQEVGVCIKSGVRAVDVGSLVLEEVASVLRGLVEDPKLGCSSRALTPWTGRVRCVYRGVFVHTVDD